MAGSMKEKDWHKWFAWHPVIVKDNLNKYKFTWLKIVLRCGEYKCRLNSLNYYCCYWIWKYKEL